MLLFYTGSWRFFSAFLSLPLWIAKSDFVCVCVRVCTCVHVCARVCTCAQTCLDCLKNDRMFSIIILGELEGISVGIPNLPPILQMQKLKPRKVE